MTIAFRNSSTSSQASSNTFTFTDPGNSGDFLIVIMQDDFGGGTGYSGPDGTWINLFQDKLASGVASNIAIFYKKSGTGSGTYVFTNAFSVTGQGGIMMAYSGVHGTNSVNTSAHQLDDSLQASPYQITGPTITTTSDNCMILWAGALSCNGTTSGDTWTAPSGYTKRTQNDPADSGWLSECWCEITAPTAGVVAAAVGTDTRSSNTAARAGYLIALAPLVAVINTQPQSQTVPIGLTATFTVTATTSGGTLHYQWKKNGSNVGTDSSSYTTPTLDMSYNGAIYTVVVSDDGSSVTSNNAILTTVITPSVAWFRA